jgi:hypothetical protein
MPKKLPVFKPSQILRKIRSGEIADPQPKGEGLIMCERKRHALTGDTESPAFWENGTYIGCEFCKAWVLARVRFKTFEIDMRGERKKYPLVDRLF